ncbi:MAG TPA: hypothetical protein VFG30_07195 [Polyangiales bacterium]|jgi:hypothetical protein|nr:hypothetical protein [Polyangiales bacterium]
MPIFIPVLLQSPAGIIELMNAGFKAVRGAVSNVSCEEERFGGDERCVRESNDTK